MRSFARAITALILIFVLFSGQPMVFADPPAITDGSAYVTDITAPWDNIGKIGDRVSYTVFFTSDIANPTAFIVVPGVGNPVLGMTEQLLGGTSYSASFNWDILQGTVNNAADSPRFIVGNASGTDDLSIGSVILDNVRPERDGIMTATLGLAPGTPYTGISVRKGQVVNFTQTMAAISTDSEQSANLNLAAAGLTAINLMASTGLPPTFTLNNIVFPDGMDNTYNFPLRIVDGRSNLSEFLDFNMNIDTKAPFFTAKSVVNAAGAALPALPGHILNFSMTINSFDNDVVQVTCASFTDAGITLPTLTPTTAPAVGAAVTFTGTLLLQPNTQIFGTQFPFEFKCTDNAGNITTATALLSSIDLALPSQSTADASVYPPAPAVAPITYVASAGTRLQFKSVVAANDAIAVTVNLTAIGGPASFPMPLSGVADTYVGTYTLTTAPPVNGSYLNFTVYAKDPSGNLVYKSTTPDILIDNVGPDITALTLTRAAGAGTIIAGDLVTVQATVTNVDTAIGGKVWIDLSSLGGSTTQALVNENLNFWRATITVASGTIDTSKFFRAYAWDNDTAQNQDTFDSLATVIDTEPPVLTLATYTVTPPLGGTHTQVNNGDVVKFEVKLASTSLNTPYDGQTVFIDLSSAGGPISQSMTLLTNENYTFTYTIPLGTLTDGATFPLVIRDNAQNKPYSLLNGGADQPIIASITIPAFDQAVPVISAFTVTRDAGPGTIHIGDTVTFEATIAGVLPDMGGTVWSDFAKIGVSNPASFTYINVSGNTWRANVTIGSGTIDVTNELFTVFAYNRADHQISRNSTGSIVDNLPPFFVNGTYTSSATQSITHPYVKIGDDITLSVELALPDDGHSVSIDLTGLGSGTAALNASSTPGFYTLKFKLATGTANDGIILPLTIRDNASNSAFDFTSGFPVAASITIDLLDQSPTNITTFTVTRNAGAGTLIVNDAVTFTATVSGVEAPAGAVWTDLRPVGGPASATFTNISGNTWQFLHTIGTGTAGISSLDLPGYIFVLNAYDKASNTFSLNSAATSVDNIAPELDSPLICTYTVSLQQNPPYMIIGDKFVVEVKLKTPDDGHTVKVDLSSLGNLGTETLTLSGGSYKTTIVVIATGPLNLGATFPITITDNAGNSPVYGPASASFDASATIPLLDQNSPDPGLLTLTVTRQDGETETSPTVINIHKFIEFSLPYTQETIFDDHATATIDLIYIGSGSATLDYVDPITLAIPGSSNLARMNSDTASYSLSLAAASWSSNIGSYPYRFSATMYDRSGNKVAIKTSNTLKYRVDCWPPQIASISATIVGTENVVRIGSKIRFRVEAKFNADEYDNNNKLSPTIDLSSLGFTLPISMAVSTPTGWYEHTATVGGGDLNNDLASWSVTVNDGGGKNYVSSYTNELSIDNFVPQVSGNLLISWADTEGDDKIKYGDLTTFTISMSTADLGTATINLTAIGGSATQKMEISGSDFILATSTLSTSKEYANYVFSAVVTDAFGNSINVTSDPLDPVTSVDCQLPSFSSHGIEISVNNGDNPLTNVSNINDVLVVFASISASLDAVATATISSGAVFIAEAPMILNGARHEAKFTVGNDSSVWGALNLASISYTLSAVDDAFNIATPTIATSTTFTVKNTQPALASHSMWLSPNLTKLMQGSNYLLNVASGTTVDLLLASATLADNARVTSGYINLSAIPGAPAKIALTALSGSIASTATGVNLSSYAQVDDTTAIFGITLLDEAGYAVTGSQTFRVDTKRPTIVSTAFDGTLINISCSEEIENAEIAMWNLVGSNTLPVGTIAKLTLANETYATSSVSFFDFDVALTTEGRKQIANWASTPLYLEILENASAPLTDLSGNWLPKASYYPLVITDSTWRESAKITSLTMTHSWPASITLDFIFSKPMATDTLIASDAALFVDTLPSIADPLDQVDYRGAYVFQASDTFNWSDTTNLRITFSTAGRDWIAKNLGSASKTLKFAQRISTRRFVKDDLGKPLTFYTSNSPLVITDNRSITPLPTLSIKGNPAPVLSLASSTLTLQLSDRALLFSNDFTTDDDDMPSMGMPVPTVAKAVSSFKTRIYLYNMENNKVATLTCQDLSATKNNLASEVVHIDLTASDITSILNLYASSANPTWGIKIDAGAFANWWGMPSSLYKPLGPGNVTVSSMTADTAAVIEACAISDMPPTKDAVGSLIFEFELTAPKSGGVTIPFASSLTPEAAIFRQDNMTRLASATFTGWSTRTVNGTSRTIASFKTAEAFQSLGQQIPAQLEIFGLKDIFENPITNVVASYVYNRNERSSSTTTGFNTASSAFIFDNVFPTVDAILPADAVGVANAGAGIFFVDFSEAIDTSVTPVLTLATTSALINFDFLRWSNGNLRAEYANRQAITITTQNGSWTYTLSGGIDTAGNAHTITSRNVQVLSNAPPVAQGGITLRTIQDTINTSENLINQPFSFNVNPTAELSITYQKTPTENLPYRVRFYNQANLLIGSAPIPLGVSTLATATFDSNNFVPALGNTGPATLTLKMADSAGNETGSLKEIIHDSSAPALTSLTLSGIATFSSGIYYYNSSMANMTANASSSNSTDPMRLTVASFPLVATATFAMTQPAVGNYQTSFGSTLGEGNYALGLADAAGNLHTGLANLLLIVDDTRPEVTAILPNTVIGNTPAEMAVFTVEFSEPMSPDVEPVLTLATTTSMQTIYMNFTGWYDINNATTAYYTNRFNIDTTLNPGTYTFNVTGGNDLAGNALDFTPAIPFTLDVQSQGPVAICKVLSLQPDIFGAMVLENVAFSSNISSSATVQLSYTSGPFNTPHQLLVYDSTNTNVATLSIAAGNPGLATFPELATSWANGTGPDADGKYSFKLIDNLGNIGPSTGYLAQSLVLDTASATISSFAFNDSGNGIATGGITYYSPLFGSATVTLLTNATDSQRLVASGTATFTVDLVSTGTTHSGKFGGSLSDGSYWLTVADFAGNMAEGDAASMSIFVDRASPTVTFVAPIADIGATAAGTRNFDITFSEHMNTGVAPTLKLASGATTIAMNFDRWLATDTVRFINAAAIGNTYPAGSYSYILTGAKDRAGNSNIPTLPGSFTVGVYAQSPVFSATLSTRQYRVSTDTALLNQPFSPAAEPGMATLTVQYMAGPYSTPHSIRIYDPTNTYVTVPLNVAGMIGTASVDAASFNNPGLIGSRTYSFIIIDSLGNLSATSSLKLVYDAVGPDIASFALTNVSKASIYPRYYHNPTLHGALAANITTTNASDPLRLLRASGTATSTYRLTAGSDPLKHSCTMTAAETTTAALPEGIYGITAVDAAGNFAYGTASAVMLIVDRTPPAVTVATISNSLYLSSGITGAATFTLTFNESLDSLATPTLTIATTSLSIACRCVSFSANQAVFTTAIAVANTIPQGEYVYQAKATDLTGNVLNAATGSVQVRSRGPVISSIVTQSYQATTASSSLVSGNEILLNQPFSFNVFPGAAAISLQLAGAPDGDASLVYLHFTDLPTGNTTIASFPLTLTGNAASFTWSIATGPQPTTPTTYLMRLADSNGDFSLESLEWRIDNASPTVNSVTFAGGENNTASSTIYFNPFKHPYIAPKFSAVENEAPRMRVRNSNSTDTYQLTSAGSNLWSTNFTGVYSRIPVNGTATRLPDGRYDIGLVDRAGNMAASGSEDLYSLIIDTQSPLVSTYSMYVASQPASTYFSPTAGNLDVFTFSTTETLTATGVYYLEILNLIGTRINKLPLVASGSGYLASWDGKNDQGNLVTDGEYRFRASDYVGNVATATIKIFAMTSEFKATSVTQISSTSAQIWFNHDVNINSLSATAVTASPAMVISNIRQSDAKAISFDIATAFAHATSYTFSIANGPGGVKNIYGASLSASGSQIILVADGQGPVIIGHSFAGLSSQNEFKIIFDEAFNITSAGNKDAYTLKNASGTAISISQSVPQSDQKTVLLTAAQQLVENSDYTIAAIGVTDTLGNTSSGSTYLFQGRDLTPPKFVVSAFSNPANEKDIIVLAVSDEPLKAPPTLYVKHGSAAAVSTAMQAGANPKAFMAGVSLNAANGSTGTLLVQGEDVSGNQGSGEGSFTIAYISASMLTQIMSTDNQLKLSFTSDSLKTDATVKILQHQLVKETIANGIIKTSLQSEFRAARGLRAAQIDAGDLQNNAELVPVTDGYEVSIASEKVNKGFAISLATAEATSTIGLGLFNQSGDTWKLVTADRNSDKAFAATMISSQIFAVMRDVVAPRVNLDAELDLSEPFTTSRPEFTGQILESGAGLDNAALVAHIDGGPAQSLQVDSNGRFLFKPLAELTGGSHELVIRAGDRTGNQSQTGALRFQVKVPLSIGQIMQYPNPASHRGFIRISANRDDLNDDLVKINIYDVAGHKVTSLDNVRAVKETWNGVNSRFLYDIAWDLRNEDGKQVANGVYFARIEVRDPENPSTKIKKSFKLAVLR